MLDKKSDEIPVMVALRCRPLIQKELKEGCQSCVYTVPGEPQVILGKDRAFTYDFAFGSTDSQYTVYETACQKIITSMFKGYNATIMAYGQTGSGKTYTMGGCYEASLEGHEEEMGIIPRVLKDLFTGMQEKTDVDFAVRVSYMEIYMEELLDLLCKPSQRAPLAIREETNGGIRIQHLKEVTVNSYEDTMKLLSDGSQSRTTGATAMNNTSSRSHAIFTLNIEMTKKDDLNNSCRVKFHLVDLAGSERCKRTQAEGDRFKEGVNINKGLLVLGNVISALGGEAADKRHIPYRDSKLTRILQDSLGGNSHTLMIACVSPADSNIEETLNTLRYADRARKIKNKPIINRDPQAAEIMKLKTLVQQLQGQLLQGGISLSSMKSDNSLNTISSSVTLDTSGEEMKRLRERCNALEEENAQLTTELGLSVKRSAEMLDKIMSLESSNDRLKLKLSEIKENMGIDLDMLSSSVDVENNPNAKAQLDKLQKLTQSMQDDHEESEEKNLDMGSEDEENQNMDVVSTPKTRAIQREHALRQAELHRELIEINRVISNKQALVEKTSRTDREIEAMKQKYDEMTKEWQAKTELLEREKDELAQTLLDAKAGANAMKLSEQRRKQLKDLEKQMSQLKKKMIEQTKVVKMKETSDKQVCKLNVELQTLKQQRVKLMKQMKEEASNFQKWKREKDKEVMRLVQKDRKREFEMHKMKRDFEKQQTVQKRKAAEAAASNKRLRDALDKQKAIQSERTGKLQKYDSTDIGNRVRKWLSHELEVKVSLSEAHYRLAQLMENRKEMTEHMQMLQDQLEEGPLSKKFSWLGDNGDREEISFEEKAIKKQITTTELDIELVNVQIEELQQKIVEADQESKGKSTWQSLHTMNEAKCALKFLLEQAVSAKTDNLKASGKARDAQDLEDMDQIKALKAQLSSMGMKHEKEMDKIRKENEEKTLFLLTADHAPGQDNDHVLDSKTKKKIQIMETAVKDCANLKEQLEEKKRECKQLKEVLMKVPNKLRSGALNLYPQQMTVWMYQNKTYSLLPELFSDTPSSPFLNPKPVDASSSTLNSTFLVEGEQQREAKPKAPLKVSEINEKNAEDPELDDSTVPSFLKRRSGDSPSNEGDTSRERRKKRKRTLLGSSTGFFKELDILDDRDQQKENF